MKALLLLALMAEDFTDYDRAVTSAQAFAKQMEGRVACEPAAQGFPVLCLVEGRISVVVIRCMPGNRRMDTTTLHTRGDR